VLTSPFLLPLLINEPGNAQLPFRCVRNNELRTSFTVWYIFLKVFKWQTVLVSLFSLNAKQAACQAKGLVTELLRLVAKLLLGN